MSLIIEIALYAFSVGVSLICVASLALVIALLFGGPV